ncbi:MAG: tryptophan synthase subunit alpha, partial [Acidimicrobiales bacterium]
GADAVEIGIPFSDPMIDGPVIQEASMRALARGTTPTSVLAGRRRVDVGIPVWLMTYYTIVFRAGDTRYAHTLSDAGVAGAILPDLQLDEADSWCEAADEAGVATVMLVAPSTPDERVKRICARSRGFVYAVGLMGVTGERAALADSALEVAARCRSVTDVPVCVGIGISTPEHAVEACAVADGAVIGSALMRRLLDGQGPEGAATFIGDARRQLDALGVTRSAQ